MFRTFLNAKESLISTSSLMHSNQTSSSAGQLWTDMIYRERDKTTNKSYQAVSESRVNQHVSLQTSSGSSSATVSQEGTNMDCYEEQKDMLNKTAISNSSIQNDPLRADLLQTQQHRSIPIVDLTSSPPQLPMSLNKHENNCNIYRELHNHSNFEMERHVWRRRYFGTPLTNSLRALDHELFGGTLHEQRPLSVQTRNNVTSASSSVQGAVKVVDRKQAIKRRYKRDMRKEIERQKLEKNLSEYSYRRPAGCIPAMSLSMKSDLQAVLQKQQKPSYDVSTHRVPQVKVLNTIWEANEALRYIQSGVSLSFDMEWPFDKATSLASQTSIVQLASAEVIYIVKLVEMKSVPKELVRVLEDESIIKTGVAISADAKKFYRDFGYQMRNCVELSSVAKQVEKEVWEGRTTLIALRDLCRIYLRRRLKKDKDLRGSEWDAAILSREQIEYAASDAYVGLELLHQFASTFIGKHKDPHFIFEGRLNENRDFHGILESSRVDPYRSVAEKASVQSPGLTNESLHIEGQEAFCQATQADSPVILLQGPIRSREKALLLWQKGSSFFDVANKLRTPPLALSTVASYIVQMLSDKNTQLNESDRMRLKHEISNESLTYTRKRYKDYLQRQGMHE